MLETVAGWIMLILLQVSPVQDMSIGDRLIYTGEEGRAELVLDDVPVPGYWSLKAELELDPPASPLHFFAAGYYDGTVNHLFTLKLEERAGSPETGSAVAEKTLFSVNEAGAPMPLLFLPEKGSQLFISSNDALLLDETIPFTVAGEVRDGTSYRYNGSPGTALISLFDPGTQSAELVSIDFDFSDFSLTLTTDP